MARGGEAAYARAASGEADAHGHRGPRVSDVAGGGGGRRRILLVRAQAAQALASARRAAVARGGGAPTVPALDGLSVQAVQGAPRLCGSASRNVRRLLRRRTEALVKQGREYLKEGRARTPPRRRQGPARRRHRASGRRLSTTAGITGAPHVDFVATLRSPQPPSAVARTPSRTPLRAVTADTGPPPTAGGEGWEDYLAQRFPECTSPASVSWPSPMREVDLDVSPRRAAGAPAKSTFRTWRRDGGSPATPKRVTPKRAAPTPSPRKAASPSPRRRTQLARRRAAGPEDPTPYDAVRTAAWPGVAVGVPVTAAAVTLVPTRSSPRAPPPRNRPRRAPVPRDPTRATPGAVGGRRRTRRAPRPSRSGGSS